MNREKLLRLIRHTLESRPNSDAAKQADFVLRDLDLMLEVPEPMKAKLRRWIAKALERDADLPISERATEAVNAVELMLRIEAEDNAASVDFDQLREAGKEAVQPESKIVLAKEIPELPKSPAIQAGTGERMLGRPEQPVFHPDFLPEIEVPPPPAPPTPKETKLIVLPEDPEFKQTEKLPAKVNGAPTPRAVPAIRLKGSKSEVMRPEWDIFKLNSEIHRLSPPNMRITVKNREDEDVDLVLERNVENGLNQRSVRITYRHPRVEDKMVQHVWNVEDLQLDIDQVLQKLHDQAVEVYRARAEWVEPHAPPPINLERALSTIQRQVDADYAARAAGHTPKTISPFPHGEVE